MKFTDFACFLLILQFEQLFLLHNIVQVCVLFLYDYKKTVHVSRVISKKETNKNTVEIIKKKKHENAKNS